MPEYSQATIQFRQAVPLGAAIRRSFTANTGEVSVQGYWNYKSETWEPTFDAERHVQPLSRASVDLASHDYKTQLLAVPVKPFADPSAFVTLYLLEDGEPKDVWETLGRTAVGIHANLGW